MNTQHHASDPHVDRREEIDKFIADTRQATGLKLIAEHLANGRQAANKLRCAISDKDKHLVRIAAENLLELAIYVVGLVEDSARDYREALQDASKKYPWFPVLLSSAGGHDFQKKLDLIKNFPVGDDRPFKRFNGKAQNDYLWRAIETGYMTLQGIRLGRNRGFLPAKCENKIRQLRDLNKKTKGRWAGAIAEYLVKGPLANFGQARENLMSSCQRSIAKIVEGKKRERFERINEKYGGTKILGPIPSKDGVLFFIQTQDGKQRMELDLGPGELTRLDRRIKEAETLKPTEADIKNGAKEAIAERLRRRLKN